MSHDRLTGRPYEHGSCTKEDPLCYEITDEFLKDLENGQWVEGMHQAAVKEIRRQRERIALLEEALAIAGRDPEFEITGILEKRRREK